MSRCFPFPPPGYVKKVRADDLDVVKKEKEREKKNRNEKKDKEKRESKGKSEKDRRDGNHREKKDKKEKSRDKKKDKEKDAKDKPGTSDGTRISGKSEKHGSEKLVHSDDRDKRHAEQVGGYQAEKLNENSQLAVENRTSVSVELDRRRKDEARGIGNQLVEKVTGSDWKKDEGMVRLVGKPGILAEVEEHSKDKRVDIQGFKDTTRGTGITTVQKPGGMVQTKVQGLFRPLESNGILAEVKEHSKDKRDIQGVQDATRGIGITTVQNHGGMVQTKVQGISRPLERNIERKTDGQEKTKAKEERGEKRKAKDREKKSQGKEKDRDKEKEEKAKRKNESKNAELDKEKRKEDKANQKNNSKLAEPNKSKESNKVVCIDINYNKISQPLKDINETADAEGNLKKRKYLKPNGVFHANDIRPNKLPRPTSSSHPLTGNGRILEPCQTAIPNISDKQEGSNNVKVHSKEHKFPGPTSSSHPLTGNGRTLEACQTAILNISDKQGGPNNVKVNGKEHKKNGIIEVKTSSVSTVKPISGAPQADPVAEASMRPPHPDYRYLSEVYTVPKIDESFDHGDEDWLFGCVDSKSKRPKLEFQGAEETAQVWSEALHIESADICALPYVVPY